MALLFIISFFIPVYTVAPDSSGPANAFLPRYTIHSNVLSLLNPFKSVANVGTDIRISSRWSADAGLGAILYASPFVNNHGESYKGARIRAGFKYYLYPRERYQLHIGMELIHNQILHREYNLLLRQGLQYAEQQLTNRKVQSSGGVIRFGVHQYLDADRRFLMGTSLGLGVMGNFVSVELPPDATLGSRVQEFIDFRYPNGLNYRSHFTLGIHLGYVIW